MASLYDSASLVMIPSGYKEDKVYSIKPTDGSGDLAFSRSNDTATRVNSSGLIEKVRTNLLTYSEDFSNAAWIKDGVTLTAGETDPNGGTLGFLITSTSAVEAVFYQANAGARAFSIFAKAGTRDNFSIVNGGYNNGASFNLATQTTTSAGQGTLAKIESVGGGWFRCSVFMLSASNIVITNSNLAGSDNAIGDSLSYAFAQSETGDIATDYIATTSAAVSVGPVANLPRLDYSGGASCPKLLLEPQRTNLALYSEQFDNAAWTPFRASVTANAATSPDGYTNADKIIDTLDNDSHGVFQSVANTSGQQYSVSVFAKAAERSFLTINITGGPSQGSFFDLSNGTIGSIISFAPNARSIEDYGNGWYRCSITYTATDGASNISIGTAISDGVLLYAGDGTSGIFAYGCQTELGAYATSYIPTLSAASTRGADAASKTGISSLIGQTEGTIFVDMNYTNTNNTADATPFRVLGSGSAQMYVEINTNETFEAVVVNSVGTLVFNSTSATQTAGRKKMAIAYKGSDFAYYINGTQIAVQTSGAFASASLDSLNLGMYSSGVQVLADSVNQALVFKTRLTNAELAALTTI